MKKDIIQKQRGFFDLGISLIILAVAGITTSTVWIRNCSPKRLFVSQAPVTFNVSPRFGLGSVPRTVMVFSDLAGLKRAMVKWFS